MTSDKNNSNDGDLFRKTVGSIKPLKTEPRHLPKKRLSSGLPIHSTRVSTESLNISMLENSWDQAEQLEPLSVLDDTISQLFIRPGLQHRTMKQLRRGKIPMEDTLDLHGATAIQAKRKVDNFIALGVANNIRAVIIVHGKGMRSANNTPVLRTRVNYWLRDNENVMGFCPAAPHHGGNGALYVLLKAGKNK